MTYPTALAVHDRLCTVRRLAKGLKEYHPYITESVASTNTLKVSLGSQSMLRCELEHMRNTLNEAITLLDSGR